jgi:hypothetical protein
VDHHGQERGDADATPAENHRHVERRAAATMIYFAAGNHSFPFKAAGETPGNGIA